MHYHQQIFSAEIEGITPEWTTQMLELKDLQVENYAGIEYADNWMPGMGRYTMQPNVEEVGAAPEEVKNLMSDDLGLQPADEFVLQLDIHHRIGGFGFDIIPRINSLSDDKLGIGLSSFQDAGNGVWGLIHDCYSSCVAPVQTIGFFDHNPCLHGRGRATIRKYNSILARAYPERPYFFHTEPPEGSIPLVQLLEAVSNWALFLIEARKKQS
jgi:hypothetical protein